MATLGSKAVGDVIKIKEDGVNVNYIIVHKGCPSNVYDSSCDGVWVLRQTTLSQTMAIEAQNNNDYENSDIHAWLNSTFLNTLDSKIRVWIKNAKIPYFKRDGLLNVQYLSEGLPCNVFLLSARELGFSSITTASLPIEGAVLSYGFDAASRIAKGPDNNVAIWWTRTAPMRNSTQIYTVNDEGALYAYNANTKRAIRPAFVLPYSLLTASDGSLSANTVPTITSDKTGNLGTLTDGFTCKYSVNDAGAADTLTVTLTLDSDVIKKFTAAKGTQYTYSLAGSDWLKTTNGPHTFKISVTDGKDTATSTATFTRACSTLSATLAEPLAADDRISSCSLRVDGVIPEDAVCTCEVTNNANDGSPVWEDCAEEVKNGLPYSFVNKTAKNGFAFNFRVTMRRGASNEGGYIIKISGGFK